MESMPPMMERLKAATGAEHARLEAQVDLARLVASPESYHALLQRFYGFYLPLEQRLAAFAWQTVAFDLAPRRKTPLLVQDLLCLGETAATLTQLPRCAELPELGDQAAACGCLYVLEGATLGGQFITRHLRRTLGLQPTNGAAFFYSYGDQVGPMWKNFGAFVNAYALSHPGSAATIIRAACTTFHTLGAWLDRRAW